MSTYRNDRSARVIAAAISRRRALQGLAGAAGLGMFGVQRRAGAALDSHRESRYLGMALTAIYPPDLPDGDTFGLVGGLTYRGLEGGLEAGTLNQPLIAALGSAAERLVGGCSVALAPLDGTQSQWAQTEFWQFPTDEDASAVRDIFATPGPNVTVLPGGGDRGAFLAAMTQSGSTTIDARYVVFRYQSIVGRITRGWQYDGSAAPPDAEESAVLLEDLRKASVRRLTTITEPDYDGLSTTVPTLPEIEAASNGGIPSPVNHWIDIVTFVGGRRIRRVVQTEEEFERFLQNHADVEESFSRIQQVTTFGGNPLLVSIDAFRHDSDASSTAFFDRIPDVVAEDVAAKPEEFAAQAIDPPPGLQSDHPSQWYENRLRDGSAELFGVRGWCLNGRDVVATTVAGGTRPPEQNDDPAYRAGLHDFGALGATLYHAWNDPDLRSDPDFLADIPPELEEFCRNWDELIAALDAR